MRNGQITNCKYMYFFGFRIIRPPLGGDNFYRRALKRRIRETLTTYENLRKFATVFK